MRIGIIGGGQLARMMALAGYPLGHRFMVLDPAPDACAGMLAEQIKAPFDDAAALSELAGKCDIVTFDFENVPVESLDQLADKVNVLPSSRALAVSQDRLAEKNLFTELGIPCATYAAVDSRDDLDRAIAEIGMPAILKTRRMGYDGKGQGKISDGETLDAAWQMLDGQSLVLEAKVPFSRELSVIAVRARDGEIRFYPLTENRHKDGILISSFAPATVGEVEALALHHTRRLLEHLDYVGVLAVEYFDMGDHLVANEMAPRVHNSGHWTIEGAACSQFENHLRAITGWPLGSTALVQASAMMNWIGAMPDPAKALRFPDAHWHDYDKEPRAGRKVGHVTITADEIVALQTSLATFAMALGDQLQTDGADSFKTKNVH